MYVTMPYMECLAIITSTSAKYMSFCDVLLFSIDDVDCQPATLNQENRLKQVLSRYICPILSGSLGGRVPTENG